MRKILVLSDSHGNYNNMEMAVKRESPDMIIHLGDGWNDARQLAKRFADIPLEQVPGNCDYRSEEAVRMLDVEGFAVMICHGHTYSVKSSLLTLQDAALEMGADVAMFGHTHKVFYEKYNGITYLNPGSIGAPGFRVPPSYGLLILDGENESIQTDIIYID